MLNGDPTVVGFGHETIPVVELIVMPVGTVPTSDQVIGVEPVLVVGAGDVNTAPQFAVALAMVFMTGATQAPVVNDVIQSLQPTPPPEEYSCIVQNVRLSAGSIVVPEKSP